MTSVAPAVIDMTGDDEPSPVVKRTLSGGRSRKGKRVKTAPARDASPDPNAPLTFQALAAKLGLIPFWVRDNGSCWLYVIMSFFGQFRAQPSTDRTWSAGCAKRRNLREPSDAEIEQETELRQALFDADPVQFDQVKIMPTEDSMGSYGGPAEWKSLANIMDFYCVVLWKLEHESWSSNHTAVAMVIFADKTVAKMPEELEAFLETNKDKKIIHVTTSLIRPEHFDWMGPAPPPRRA